MVTFRKLVIAASALAGVFAACLHADWEPDQKLSTTDSAATLNENMGRCLVACGDTLHVVWCDTQNNGSAIFYKRSSDQGTTWGPDTRLSGYPGTADFPTLAVSGPMLHLAFRDSRTGDYRSYYKRSTDGGRTWGADRDIGDSGVFNWWPAIASVGANVYVALNEDTVNSEVYFRRSTDDGTTWDTVQRISNAPGRSEDPCIAAGGSCVHIVWNDFRNGGPGQSEVYYRRSTDQGLTWGPETRLTNALGMSYSPTVCPSDSNVDVAWEDNRDTNFSIYRKRSTDFGLTWGSDERLTPDTVGYYYPSITVNGLQIDMVWFNIHRGVFYLHSGDGGVTWDSVYQLTGYPAQASQPFIALTGQVLHVIWRDMRDGHGAVYYKRNLNVSGVESDKTSTAYRLSHTDLNARIVRGVIDVPSLPLNAHCSLLSADGRIVLSLHPGANDVSRLGAGVYFIALRGTKSDERETARVVITR